MKAIISISLIIVFYSLNAQLPTINYQSLPQPGDTFAYIVDINPNISFNYQQTNAIWNFSNLQNDTVKFASYGISSQLSFASSFPESNLYTYGPGFLYGGLGGGAPYTNNFGYMMFVSNINGFNVVGYRSDFGYGYTNVLLQPKEILMRTPFTYNDSIFQSTTWEIAFNSIPLDYDTIYKRYIYKYLVSTGYGSLITPYGTFNNCLAVKEYLRYYDTIEVKYGTFTITKFMAQSDTLLNVHVWSSNKRNNLLTASYNPHNLTCTYVEYLNYEDLNIVQENQLQSNTLSFPNPIKSGEICYINFYATKAKIYNTEGKLVAITGIIDKSYKFPTLSKGNYYIQFLDNDNIVFKTTVIVVE